MRCKHAPEVAEKIKNLLMRSSYPFGFGFHWIAVSEPFTLRNELLGNFEPNKSKASCEILLCRELTIS